MTQKLKLLTVLIAAAVVTACGASSPTLSREQALALLQGRYQGDVETFVLPVYYPQQPRKGAIARVCSVLSARSTCERRGISAADLSVIIETGQNFGYWSVRYSQGTSSRDMFNLDIDAYSFIRRTTVPSRFSGSRPAFEVALYTQQISEVNGIRMLTGDEGSGKGDGTCEAEGEYRFTRNPISSMGQALAEHRANPPQTACFQLFDDGWRLTDDSVPVSSVEEYWWREPMGE